MLEASLNSDRQIRLYENGKFWQVIRIDDTLFLVTIVSAGTTEKPALVAELRSDSEITELEKRKTKDRITALFNLDFDPTLFTRI